MKTKIGIVIIVLCAFLQNVSEFGNSVKRYLKSPRTDEVTRHEDRFTDLRKVLPKHGVVGYVTDQHHPEGGREYFQTQYTLAPAIITGGKENHLVIGNFHGTADGNDIAKTLDLVLLCEFGNGLFLFKNERIQ